MLIKNQKIIMTILIALVFMLMPVIRVEAKTVRDLKNELNSLQQNSTDVNNKITYTNAQITSAQKNIDQLYKDIDNIAHEIVNTTQQITDLNTKITDKKAEISQILAFIQVSNGESVYMDYIAGAESMTDFIYRVSVSEQILKYNDDLIKEMNNMIAENNQKKIDLANQQEESKEKQQQLYKNLDVLGQQKSQLYDENVSLADEIKTDQAILDMYIKAGCKDDDNISTCANKLLPPDTKFWRPLIRGYVTSEYGWRVHPVTGSYTFHDGIDLSNGDKNNTLIYAAANGKVAAVGYQSSMGNYIYIHHNINGKTYTTTYLHLKSGSIRVKPGDIVSKDTILATMGATGDATGPHLHFAIATGLRGQDYVTYDAFINHTINPRSMVNFTSGYNVYWYDRMTKYY